MSIQAMRQALEALQDAEELLWEAAQRLSTIEPAIQSLRAAIEAAEKVKPLSDEEIDRELIKNDYYSRSFTAGVRFAEKHHGIGDNNENTNT